MPPTFAGFFLGEKRTQIITHPYTDYYPGVYRLLPWRTQIITLALYVNEDSLRGFTSGIFLKSVNNRLPSNGCLRGPVCQHIGYISPEALLLRAALAVCFFAPYLRVYCGVRDAPFVILAAPHGIDSAE